MAIYDFDKEKLDYTQAFYELLLSLMTSNGGNTDLSAPRLSRIGAVRLKIDELQPQKEGVQFIQTTSNNISNVLDMYINGILDEAAKHLLQMAPVHVLYPTDGNDCTVVPVEGKAWGHIVLNTDFLRFVSLKMNTWLQEIPELLVPTDPRYKLQKYPQLMGGPVKPAAVLNAVRKVNVPVAMVEKITLEGTSGSVNIACAGLLRSLSFDTSLTITAAGYVTANQADFADEGVLLTSNGADIVFTAAVAGVPFARPWISNVSGDLTGTVTHVVENVPAIETQRVIEYYSIGSGGTHTIENFMYIGLTGAEYIQADLTDALEWLCASKILQIMGGVTGKDGSADKAMAQVQLSLQNMLR